ncbi:uncharacterized protein [Ptychodera flava]|uniref:uncharacterized protein n=1 Tax=Ptychodera flava TaxID=63121 RepID=UPI00396A78CF
MSLLRSMLTPRGLSGSGSYTDTDYRDVEANRRRRVDNSKSSFGSLSQVDEAVRTLLLHPNDMGQCKANPLTHRGKRIQLAKMLLLTLLPVLSLAVLAVIDLHGIAYGNSVDIQVRNVIRFSRDIGVLLSRLQRERDMTALYISVIGPVNKAYLTETYPLTDSALQELQEWPVKTHILRALPFFRKKEDFRNHLARHRADIGESNATVYEEINFYTDAIQIFIDWLYESVGNSKGTGLWQTLVAYQFLIVSNVDTGIERTLGSVFFSRGGFDRYEDYVWYLEKYNVGRTNFKASKKYSPLIESLYMEQVKNLQLDENFTHTVQELRRQIIFNNEVGREPNFDDAALWFDSMTVYIDILADVQKNLADEILIKLENELENDTEAIAVSIFLVIVVIIMCPLTLQAIRTQTTNIQNYALTLATQTKALNREKKRSNWLLYSMLPKTVAEQLMRHEDVKAEYYHQATVFFSDVVGFDRLCAESTPMQVVEMLNGLYLLFDSRIELYDVYKVETINETYMLASGLPERNGIKHVGEMATAALDLLHNISYYEIPHKPYTKIKVRIGMHIGPVVGGVVGLKMPRYCLFGDTVNTASRLQTNSLPSRIHISYNCYMGLLDLGGYTMVKRGEIEMKGKGTMSTYWLTSKDTFNANIQMVKHVYDN